MTTVAKQGATPTPAAPSSAYMIAVMTLVATLCGLLIVAAYQITQKPIERNEKQILQEAILGKETGIMPRAERLTTYAVNLQDKTIAKLAEGATAKEKFYAGYDASGALVGIVMEGVASGYGGPMKAIFNYAPDQGIIVGFSVLDHRETPGLGDKIKTDAAFLENFKELAVTYAPETQTITNPIATVRHGRKNQPYQIDAISGATISSKAVGRLLAKSVEVMTPIIMAHIDQIRRGE